MKSIINKSHLILSAIFIMGVVGSAYLLYNLPGTIERISAKIDILAISEAAPALSMLNVVVGVTLLFGVISLLTMYFRFSRTQVVEKIVYVDRKEDKQTVEADLLAKQVQADFSRECAEIISAVKGH
ncbi:MAG: hypothetical protein U5K79_20705 [Cyclobacteriaceae bacterium]|nr:hypothetical protein [Cyclobacteriaceae bacterium]